MGIGIWSMHFIGMLALRLPGIDIYYDIPLLILSILVAIAASMLALFIVTNRKPTALSYIFGSIMMGGAIAGMHYIGIASMRMPATISWDYFYVALSILVAMIASFGALFLSFRLKDDLSIKGFGRRGLGGILMGIAISGMHYTGMYAMMITLNGDVNFSSQQLLASENLATAIVIGTLLVLGLALTGSNVDRALVKKTLLNDALEDGIKSRDEFLSIASHELKTPLTSMKLNLEFIIRQIEKGETDTGKIAAAIMKTDKGLNRITSLVDDMLDMSRIQSGKLTLDKVEANLSKIVTEEFERFKPQFEMAGVPAPILRVEENIIGRFDVFRMDQVVTNLLSNSLKYGDGKPVQVQLSRKDNSALLTVIDQGVGISEENQLKIFNRFDRGASPKEIAGLGLGLSIVEEIVKSHSGKIWVESTVGKGSIFYVEIPLA